MALIAHTNCGVYDPDAPSTTPRRDGPARSTRCARDWGTFTDPRQALREDAERLRTWPDRPDGLALAAYLFDVGTGALEEVVAPQAAPAV